MSLKPQTEEEAEYHLRRCKDQYKTDIKYKADLKVAINDIKNALASRQNALKAEQRNENIAAEQRYQNDLQEYDQKFQTMNRELEGFVKRITPTDFGEYAVEVGLTYLTGKPPTPRKTRELKAVDAFRKTGKNDKHSQDYLKKALSSVLKTEADEARFRQILSQCPPAAPNKEVRVGDIGRECSRLEENLAFNQSRLRQAETRIKNVEHRYGVQKGNDDSFQFPPLNTFYRLMPE